MEIPNDKPTLWEVDVEVTREGTVYVVAMTEDEAIEIAEDDVDEWYDASSWTRAKEVDPDDYLSQQCIGKDIVGEMSVEEWVATLEEPREPTALEEMLTAEQAGLTRRLFEA